MHISLKSLTLLVSGSLLVACGTTGGDAGGNPKATYEQSLQEARAAHKKAESVNNAWTNSEKLLEDAEKAASEGKLDDATRLAIKAKDFADLAYQQYEREKSPAVKFPQ